MVRHTLKILQHLLQDFWSVSDHFGTLCNKGLRTLALVFLFLVVRRRFPSRLSLLQFIRNRYGGTIVKLVRKFQKVAFKHRKVALDLNFLQTFCVANKSLWRTQAYQKCLNHLLLAEINNNKKNLKVLVDELSSVSSYRSI